MQTPSILDEQARALALHRDGKKIAEIAREMGLSRHQARRRLAGAKKRDRLDPTLARRLEADGLTDMAGLHSGWLLDKNQEGSGSSLYFYLGPDQERVNFAEAMVEVLSDIPKLKPITLVRRTGLIPRYANWIALADLHVGGDYDDPILEETFYKKVDDLVTRLPRAVHAVLYELGDLLEANDHKGITPGSGNHLEARIGPAAYLQSVQCAIRLIRYFLMRLLETHETVEAHFIKGNHDPTAHVAVMLALEEHFRDNPRITIVVTGSEYRVVPWGKSAAFPHHGDTLKWAQLKDVWADQFPEEWAAAPAYRLIMTAHFHHWKAEELVGATAEHYQTIGRPNAWAKAKGLFSRGSLTAITVDKEHGEEHRTRSPITNTVRGETPHG